MNVVMLLLKGASRESSGSFFLNIVSNPYLQHFAVVLQLAYASLVEVVRGDDLLLALQLMRLWQRWVVVCNLDVLLDLVSLLVLNVQIVIRELLRPDVVFIRSLLLRHRAGHSNFWYPCRLSLH